jgi:hypothetical protein
MQVLLHTSTKGIHDTRTITSITDRTYLGFRGGGGGERRSAEGDLRGRKGTHGREREYKDGGGGEFHDAVTTMHYIYGERKMSTF